MELYLIIALGLIVTINLCVSVYVATRSDLERFQKIMQIILVWLIPIIMASIVFFINRDAQKPLSKGNKPFGGGARDSSGVAYSGSND